MTIKDCIDRVDNLKPNQYTITEKVIWLSFIEKIIINEVLKTHEGYDGRYDDFEGYSEDKLTVKLIVPSPYDRLYFEFLKMKIDEANGETTRYNNSATLFNSAMDDYKKYYNKTHLPLDTSKPRVMKPSTTANVNLTDAEFEAIVKELTFVLTEYFSGAVAPNKIYDIVMKYMQNNAEMFKGKDVIQNLKDGENGSVYMANAILDNLGLGAFAGGFKGQATADYSATAGYGSVVGVRGYKVEKITYTTPPLVYTLKLSTLKNDDTNESACPQIAVGAKFRLLRKFCAEDATCPDEEKKWYLTGTGTIDTINEETNEITISLSRAFSDGENSFSKWTAENAPLLVLDVAELPNSPWKVLSDEYAKKCLGDVFCFGPDAYPLTSEQITDLTAMGIKVGSGSRGISTGHFGTVFGKYGFSYNNRGRSIGESSKCGGQECWARAGGSDVHGERCQTLPTARFTFVRGGFNIASAEYGGLWGVGNYLYTRGGTGRGTYAEKDTEAKYLDFIGIGSDDSNRQNGYTFDKQGNAWYKGRIKVGGAGYDDPESAYIATIGDVNTAIDSVMAEIIKVQKTIVGGEL